MAIHNIKMKKKNKTDWDILYPLTLASNVNLDNGQTVQQELNTIFDNTATSSKNGAMSSIDKAKLDGIEANANRYVHPNDANTRHVTDKQISVWNDKYTKLEIDNKFNELNSGLDWKESVATFDDIATTYPNPQDGWTVNTKDTDVTYRYTGTTWIAISANAIPMASQTTDGKMSKTDKKILDNLNVKVPDLERDLASLGEGMAGDLSGLTSRVATTENNIKNINTDISSLKSGKADANHNHDSIYAKVSHTHNYLPLSGGSRLVIGTASSTSNSDAQIEIQAPNSGIPRLTFHSSGRSKMSLGATSGDILQFTTERNGTYRIANANGYVDIGTQNSSFAHYNTDRASHWFNKEIRVAGEIYAGSEYNQKVYHTGNKPTPADIGAATSSHTHNYAGSSSAGGAATSALACTGNSATATKLQTIRTINGTNFDGSANITTANWGTARTITIGSTGKSVNGSANVSWSLAEIGAAAASHTHNLINLNSEAFAGGNDLNTYNSTQTWVARTLGSTTNRPADYYTVLNVGANSNSNFQLAHSYGNSSILYVRGRHDTSGNYTPWAKVYTDKNKPTAADIGAATSSHTHNYAGSSSAGGAATSALTCTGNSATATKLATARTINGVSFDGSANITITAAANGGTSASCSGNSATATTLQTARTINGTSFNGSANITTANWGTARTITIGNSGKSVNGSANVSWSLSEIGAAAASHTHSNYVPTTDYALTTISKTLTLTTSWQDTGITGANLASGSYMIQVSGMDSTATNTYSEIWTGTMSWYNGTTNSTDSDEIVLHKAGHASNGKTIYLRTIRTSSSGYLKLQIAASAAFSSSNITFKFRKLI